tara:strand:+ start:21560 stop:23287 length:1728 start_codon:yes stop_codon:yes gene_type:complete
MSKIIHFGVCLDNKDPLLSGRVRGVFDSTFKSGSAVDYDESVLTDILSDTIEKAGKEGGDPKYTSIEDIKWSVDDPHIIPPLLPLFINIIPAPNEDLKLIAYQTENTMQNVQYIGPTISQPTKYGYEYYANARIHTSRGTNVDEAPQLRNSTVSQACFPYENSIALNGRNNSDFIFGNRQVILRAGQFHVSEPTAGDTTNTNFPKTNFQQSIIQLDNFKDKLTLDIKDDKKKKELDAPLKYLIEYSITNWSGGAALDPTVQRPTFDGNITLYEVVPLEGTEGILAGKIGIKTDLATDTKLNLQVRLSFSNQTEQSTITIINEFLREADIGKLTNPPWNKPVGLSGETYVKQFVDEVNMSSSTSGDEKLMRPFPLYYRPDIDFTKELGSTDYSSINAHNAAVRLRERIMLTGVNTGYYGLAFSAEERNVPVKENITKLDDAKWQVGTTQGIASTFGNEILLFSYDASIPDKEKATPIVDALNRISPEVGDNIGLDQHTLVKLSRDNMEPLVRGQQLLKLLREMWDFISNHEHGLPGTSPFGDTKSTRTEGPATKDSIKTALANAEKSVLNQHIKIN